MKKRILISSFITLILFTLLTVFFFYQSIPVKALESKIGFENQEGFLVGSPDQTENNNIGPSDRQWTSTHAAPTLEGISGEQSLLFIKISDEQSFIYMNYDISGKVYALNFIAKYNSNVSTNDGIMNIYYSTNRGESWTFLSDKLIYSTEALTYSFEVPQDLEYDYIRFKLELTSPERAYVYIDDLTFFYHLKQYHVSFNSNGGSTIDEAISDKETGKIQIPSNPTKKYYSFLGWYMDSELTTIFDFNDPITYEMTLYAKWQFNYGAFDSFEPTANLAIKYEKQYDNNQIAPILINSKDELDSKISQNYEFEFRSMDYPERSFDGSKDTYIEEKNFTEFSEEYISNYKTSYFTLEKNGDAYYIKSAKGQYLYARSASQFCMNSSSEINENSSFSISFNGDEVDIYNTTYNQLKLCTLAVYGNINAVTFMFDNISDSNFIGHGIKLYAINVDGTDVCTSYDVYDNDNYVGIKYKMTFEKEYIDLIKENYPDGQISFGISINNGNKESSSSLDPYNSDNYGKITQIDDFHYYTLSFQLKHIPLNYLNKDLTARFYIEIAGTRYYSSSIVTSVKTIAAQLLNNDDLKNHYPILKFLANY